MKRLNTFKDAASVEIAWFKALTAAKNDGFTHVVTAIAIPAGVQKHYFKSLGKATEFYLMTKENKQYWNGSFVPCTIESALKQCWS